MDERAPAGITRQLARLGGSRRARWVLLIGMFLVSLPAVTTRLYASDEIEYFAFLRSLWFDHDLSFENEYQYFYDRGIARAEGFHETFLELKTATGRRLNFGTIGCAILWAPFYAVGDVVARARHAAGASIPIDGFSGPYIAAVAYGSAVYGFLAVLLSLLVAERVLGTGARVTAAALAVWIGTPLLFYAYLAPGMAHACSAFAVAAFVWTWLRVREHWSARGLAALGALAALMGMVREQDLFFAIGPAVDFAWTLARPPSGAVRETRRRLALSAFVGVLTFAVAYLPQAIAYLTLNGRLGPSQVVERKMSWTAPYALPVLLSPEHGLLFWTPLVLLGIAGLVWLAITTPATDRLGGQSRLVAWCLLLMFVAQVYVSGSVSSWTVAGAFGQRRFVGTTVLLVVGLAALFTAVRGRRTRPAALAATALSVWWNLGLMAQFGTGLMDRQRLEPARNAYNTFVVIPRMAPELAYRYLFDRASFYRSRERDVSSSSPGEAGRERRGPSSTSRRGAPPSTGPRRS